MTLVRTAVNLGEKMKTYPEVLAFFIKPRIWHFGRKCKTHVQDVQSYCFCPLNMQICDVPVPSPLLASFSTDDENDYEYEDWKQVLRSMRSLKSLTADS